MDTSRRSLCASLPILFATIVASAQDQSLPSFVTPFDKLEAKKNGPEHDEANSEWQDRIRRADGGPRDYPCAGKFATSTSSSQAR